MHVLESSTHSVSDKPGIQLGVEKLGICIGRRLTDTGRFGTLGICRFTFGRLTQGRLLVKLLWKRKKRNRTKNAMMYSRCTEESMDDKETWHYVQYV